MTKKKSGAREVDAGRESSLLLETKLKEELERFTNRVIDFHYGLPNLMEWAELSVQMHRRELDRFVEKFGRIENGPRSGTKTHLIPREKSSTYESIRRRHSAARTYARKLPGLHLVALIEELDFLIGGIAKVILDSPGGANRLQEKQINFSELSTFSSFCEAKTYLIEREVDKILREGILGQLKWLAGIGLKIPDKHPFVLRSIELSERRNCVVHADNRVSRFYLDNCRTSGVDTKTLKVGDEFRNDRYYVDNAFETCVVFGTIIFASTWIKLCKKSDNNWDKLIENLNHVAYSLTCDQHPGVASSLLQFVVNELNIEPTDSYRRMIIVNLANAYKKTNRKNDASDLLNKEDWRGSDFAFQSSVAAVLGKTQEALNFIRRGVSAEQLTRKDLEEWPVFDDIRKTKGFKKLYNQLFGADQESISVVNSKEPLALLAVKRALRDLEVIIEPSNSGETKRLPANPASPS